ncbi:uncharacterized protein MELLADRAFT_124374 [Melampsora larici-populina 98AG31]|uniref:Secreted protein n=1 Tax=Melampsora larici-populina (strain 98AG31 / pathotype 3-4-7) TaxID=747676 RepID=F4RMK5_MELLP|nr:uncharacterized protein MELLADRAFT_124374 [Melampsora larici-populina 98AG31]EGG06451.1 secreted protein [Melampsora larici-populina 98AG31]
MQYHQLVAGLLLGLVPQTLADMSIWVDAPVQGIQDAMESTPSGGLRPVKSPDTCNQMIEPQKSGEKFEAQESPSEICVCPPSPESEEESVGSSRSDDYNFPEELESPPPQQANRNNIVLQSGPLPARRLRRVAGASVTSRPEGDCHSGSKNCSSSCVLSFFALAIKWPFIRRFRNFKNFKHLFCL